MNHSVKPSSRLCKGDGGSLSGLRKEDMGGVFAVEGSGVGGLRVEARRE